MAILILDDDDDLRATLGDLFALIGEQTVGAASLPQLIGLGARALECTLAILDVNLGPHQASGVDAYSWLTGRHFAGRIVFLTGHGRTHPLVASARALGVRVYEKPVGAQELERLAAGEAP